MNEIENGGGEKGEGLTSLKKSKTKLDQKGGKHQRERNNDIRIFRLRAINQGIMDATDGTRAHAYYRPIRHRFPVHASSTPTGSMTDTEKTFRFPCDAGRVGQ